MMVLILDSTVLINFIDRCPVPDILDLMLSYPFEIHVVQTVIDEYERGVRSRPGSVNERRYYEYVPNKLKVVDDSGFHMNIPNEFLGLHAGELMSAVYKQQSQAPMILCTDDKATHIAYESYNGKKCLWSSDILVLLHQRNPSLIRQREARTAYQSILRHGFTGIPPQHIDFSMVFDFTDYY